MTHDSAASNMENNVATFSDLDISPELKQGIEELGYSSPTAFQKGVFDNFKNGLHVVGSGQSSYGKSLAFSLPIISKLVVDNQTPQALIVCESTLLAEIAQKEYRALSRHLGITVGNGRNSDGSYPQVLVMSVDDLEKLAFDDVTASLTTIFIDGLSAKNAPRALALLANVVVDKVQVLIFGDATIAACKETMQNVIDNAATISNNDQPKITVHAKHLFVLTKEAEPKPRALLGAIEVLKPKAAVVSCNEAQECDLLSRYLSHYGYKTVVVSEEQNRHGLADALRDCVAQKSMVICQNSLLPHVSLEQIPHLFNYDMFERAENYEQATQFGKQAPGLERCIVNILMSREQGMLGPIRAQCQIEIAECSVPSEEEVMDMCAARIRDALLAEASEVELGQFELLAKKIFEAPTSAPILSLLLRNYLLRAVAKSAPRESFDRDRGGRSRGPQDRRRNDRGGDRGERGGERSERSDRGDRGTERNDRRDRPVRSDRDERRERRDSDGDTLSRDIDGGEPGQTAPSASEGITRLYVTLGRKDGLFDLASLAQYLSDKSGVDLGHFSGSGMIRDTSAHIEVDDDVAEDIIKSLHNSPRPEQEGAASGEQQTTVVCERARASTQQRPHHRRPQQRRRPPYQQRRN